MKRYWVAACVALSVGLAQQQTPSAQPQPEQTPPQQTQPANPALQKAQADLEANRLDDAVRGFELVIAQDYSNYPAHFGLGLALYRKGDLRGARFEFQQLTVLAPERYDGWFNLGVTLDRLGQDAEASQAFARAVQIGEQAGLTP
ncbi:MAG: tetratricopeptide repeat protein, partial [Meiothermus silvanus]|nr:tetratricopeptide repeat protein [Allomeiothermus silvanus]